MSSPANDNATAAPRAMPYRPHSPAASGILPGLKWWHVLGGLLCIPFVIVAAAVYLLMLAWQEWRHPRRPSRAS